MINALKRNAVAKAFTHDKLVNNQLLNRLGLQVARSCGARLLYNVRPTPRNSDVSELLGQLRTDGMVAVENFFTPEKFEQLRTESMTLFNSGGANCTSKNHGPTEYSFARFPECLEADYPMIAEFYSDPRLWRLMQAAEKNAFSMAKAHRGVERVRQGADTTVGDPETDLHSDIFYHTHKAWLYLTDVTPPDAPLVFVRGSHRITMAQLRHIYRHSCNPVTPSRRVLVEEMESMGWKEETLECKRNTLVVANVCGYHRRSIGKPGGERYSLHCSIRLQPFALWRNR